MHWILLILSGSLEAVWAHALSDILDPVNAIVFLLGLTGSVWGLQRAMKVIPMGTAYAIWVGVGASVTAIWSGIEGEPFGPAKIAFLALIMVGVIGLELSRGKGTDPTGASAAEGSATDSSGSPAGASAADGSGAPAAFSSEDATKRGPTRGDPDPGSRRGLGE